MEKWKVIESTYLHKEPWLTVRKDRCELPNGHIVPSFYINEYPDWVNAFALTKEGKVIMVQQYRHGIREIGMEIPGGVIDAGETWQQGAERELLEETGYRFAKLEYLGKISANPSTTNNFMHMFLATGGEKIAEQNLDQSEEIEIKLLSIEEVMQLIKENKIMQSLHVTCIFYALMQLNKINF